MRSALLIASCLAMLAGAGLASAQQPTTVQLPSYRIFSVRTTVSVPDSGGAYLDGVNRARSGSTSRGLGPRGSRGIGSDRSAGGAGISATIIDHAVLDKRVLAQAEPATPATGVTAARGDTAPVESVAAIRACNAAAAQQQASEAARYFAQGRLAEAEGKPGIAKIYYRMAARRTANR
ncbi:MAG: hypothetical protein WD872_09090 [Pirellulaceae bacterium]